MGSTGKTAKRQRTCPICGKPAVDRDDKAFPFCSERCQLVDLARWLDEDYRIPDTTGDSSREDT